MVFLLLSQLFGSPQASLDLVNRLENPPLPAPMLVRAAEVLGMENLSENFSRLH